LTPEIPLCASDELKPLMNQGPRTVFFYYTISEERRRVIKSNLANDPVGYCLYGARDLEKKSIGVLHNLEPDIVLSGFRCSLVNYIDHFLHAWSGLWGNLETVLAHRKRANVADVIIATADNVGIPVAFLKLLGFIRPPVIYVSIGLPEKIMHIRNHFWIFLYKAALKRMACILAYGFEEALWLRKWLNDMETLVPVDFIPFGVDVEYFDPLYATFSYRTDVLSIGADVQRDYPLLLEYAKRHPGISVMIVTNKEAARILGPVPDNVNVICDVPFSGIRGLFAGARVVALPVKENTYSGATTTLLQAMAMEKPVVISRVGAICEGYGLKDGENCLLVRPGDMAEFGMAIDKLLSDSLLADKIGQGARTLVVATLSWGKYVDGLVGIIEKTLSIGKGGLVPA
jgi:glycosyltransferase involved in cell wall biosynthesis